MRLPNLSPPIKRPDLIQPSLAVDVEHGRPEDLVNIRIDLLHGANYNDPAAYRYPGYDRVRVSGYGSWGLAWF